VTVAPPVAVPAGVVYVPIAPHNPYLGPAKPKVVIVAFTDFESPDTKAVAAILKRAIDDHPQDLVLVLKNLPAPSHPGAVRAARALQAARRQDKAWEIYAELVAHTAALAPADLVRYATKVDLDVAKFKTDLDDPTVEQEVAADRDLATQVGVHSAPTCFVNGRKLQGVDGLRDLDALIAEQIKAALELLWAGTPPMEIYPRLSGAQ
jgi:protein-disulfide isomerase